MRSESRLHWATILGATAVSAAVVAIFVVLSVDNLRGWHEASQAQFGPPGPSLKLPFRSDVP